MTKTHEIRTYLAKHRIQALFTSLTAALAIHKPADVRAFLVTELQKTRPGQLVTREEAEAVFDLFDLRKTGNLSRADAATALTELGFENAEAAAKVVSEVITKESFVTTATGNLIK